MKTLIIRLILALLLVALLVAGGLGIAWRENLCRQWTSYQIGAAETYAEAEPRLAWCDQGDRQLWKIRLLLDRWGTGNARFDTHIAQYVNQPESSEACRREFSLSLAWVDDRPSRWAHYWSYQTTEEPARQMELLVEYFDLSVQADPPLPITWREVLQLQAVFTLAGDVERARRLSPENWAQRYRLWQSERPDPLPNAPRPTTPMPDAPGGT